MRLLFVIKNAMILLGGIFLLFYLYVKVKEQPWFSGFDVSVLTRETKDICPLFSDC